MGVIRDCASRNERVLVTTLTKKMAEELTAYLAEHDIRVRYLHSDIDTVERMEIIRDLRLGEFDALIGINLLREGLDMPEVSTVAILDADKEGFLRSTRSLIQTVGRAARNVNGKAIFYADKITDSMKETMDVTSRRRELQEKYNHEHGITPVQIKKKIVDIMEVALDDTSSFKVPAEPRKSPISRKEWEQRNSKRLSAKEITKRIDTLNEKMLSLARELKFEEAAAIRDEIADLKQALILMPGMDPEN